MNVPSSELNFDYTKQVCFAKNTMYPGSFKDVQCLHNDGDTLFPLFFSEFRASWKFWIAELPISLKLHSSFQNSLFPLYKKTPALMEKQTDA